MRSYVPNTVEERREMLKTLGLSEMDELFADIPADLKLNRELDLPAPMSEMELRQLITGYVLFGMIVLIGGQLLVERVFVYSVPVSVFITVGGGVYFLYLLLTQRKA